MRGRMTDAHRRLAEAHVGIADGVASAMAKRGMPYDECYASALAGLCEAAMQWRPDGGASFPTFAQRRVKGRILDDLRDWDYLSRKHRDEQPGHFVSSISGNAGRNYLNGNRGDIRVDELVLSPVRRLRRASRPRMTDGPTCKPTDQFSKILDHLPDREHRMVFTLYYAEGMSMRQVGKAIGVGESRVSQIITAALPLLKAKLTPASGCHQSAACRDARSTRRSAR